MNVKVRDMRHVAIFIIFLAIVLAPMPAAAYTEPAEDFLQACRQPDTPFPPEDWSHEEIRDAALEVLDAFENDEEEGWVVHFCLVALGHAGFSEDLPRILAYEDTMTATVLRSLSGYPSAEAVECLLRHITSERASFRDRAIRGLMEIDFDELDDSEEWREKVSDELAVAREAEAVELLVELIDEALSVIESATEED